ncbi:DUF2237 domain-containing protein [Aquimarina sp. BL5]|uniref:DUF2237 family protein n=1 Tax=Aquimarina sp. BL5 TaxID=1714860 RepID=UPI000E4E2992|nr:DUF2237 domain-containing protein [Aquimarina sp. BL5]AXT51125.1 DUF2237 domain-containing protein [Aquimarina sp. BL5]RKN06016.1 DUF2237 family protein [Aquimarina sp. BL5]
MTTELNVLGTPLQPCCYEPMTGYYRDGLCRTNTEDTGTHIICAVVTSAFLAYTKSKGNDLSTPLPYWNFPGLKPGDKWCLCISRWLQAQEAGNAPLIVLESCHQKALEYTDIETLLAYKHTL